jgi:hypothetical protein
MKRSRFTFLFWLVLFSFILFSLLTSAGASPTAVNSQSPGRQNLEPPLFIIENSGQFDPLARFQVRASNQTLWLAADGWWLTVLEPADLTEVNEAVSGYYAGSRQALVESTRRGVNLNVTFVGANPNPTLEPFGPLTAGATFLTGGESPGLAGSAPTWRGVRYVDLYPGLDLEIGHDESGRLLPRLVCKAQCDTNLQAVRLRVEGAEGQALPAANGRLESDALQLTTAIGEVLLPLLTVVDSQGRPIQPPAAPALEGSDVVAPFRPVGQAIRPEQPAAGSDLIYSLFFTGSNTEYSWDNAIDTAGNAYLTGMTDSTDFPVTPGAFDTTLNDSFDAFVVKLDAAGQLVYATYLGGTMLDQGSKIAVDTAGNAYIAGYTYSTDFPVSPDAYDPDYNGGNIDAFVSKLNSEGSHLLYSTYLGGTADDYGGGITVDGQGNAYMTGYTESFNFPTTDGAYDTDYNTEGDVVAVKINPAGDDLLYSTYIGAIAFEAAYGIGVDDDNSLYLSGITYSADFPVTDDAYDVGYNGGLTDAFVLKLLPDGSDLAYSSYLGGNDFEDARGLAVTGAGDVYLAGRTNSINFPTTDGAYDIDYNGGRDAFVVHLNAAGDDLIFSTYIGGGGEDEIGGIGIDPYGNSYVAGWTFSEDFPVTLGAYDTGYNFDYDAFLVKLAPAGDTLLYGTFLGNDTTNYARGIAVDSAGSTYLTGYVVSPPDAFALKLAPGGIGPTPTPSQTPNPTATATPTETATATATTTPAAPHLYLPAVQND